MEKQQKMAHATAVGDMTEGSVFRKLVRFALPLMLANALQTVYALVDTVVVGQALGSVELAAVSTISELVNLYTMIGMGLASAGQVIVGQFVGRRDMQSVTRIVGNLALLLAAVAVGCTLLCYATVGWQFSLMNVPEESLPAARAYFLTCTAGLLFIFGYNCVSAILRGMGDSKRPLIFVAIAAMTNLVLDLLFVLVLHIGVFGAALATVMGQGLSLVISIIYLYHKREAFGLSFSRAAFRPRWVQLRLILRLGIPHAIQYAAVVVSILFVNANINAYGISIGMGVAVSAVNGVTLKLENILRIVSNSMATAGCTVVAQNMGAGKPERVNRVVNSILAVCGIYSALCALALGFLHTQIFSLFNSEPEVLAYTPLYILPGILCYLGYSLRAPFNAVINGVGNARLGLISGLMDGVAARIGLSLLLGSLCGMGLVGYWLGSALAGYVTAIIGAAYYYSGRWKKFQLLGT